MLVLFIYCSMVDVMVHVRVGKDFPDMRQGERRIKFISVGDVVRTAGRLKGELTAFSGWWLIFIAWRRRKFLLEWW